MRILHNKKGVVPAQAGVILLRLKFATSVASCSRASGGDPDIETKALNVTTLFPRKRG